MSTITGFNQRAEVLICACGYRETYVTATQAKCYKNARFDGWKLNPAKGRAKCPKCSGRVKEVTGFWRTIYEVIMSWR